MVGIIKYVPFTILLFERAVVWNHVENLPGRVYEQRKAHIVLGGELVSMSTLFLSFCVCRVDSFSQLHFRSYSQLATDCRIWRGGFRKLPLLLYYY